MNSAITALQTHVSALQRSLEDQTNKLRSEKSHLLEQSENFAEIVATRDRRIEEFEEQNRRQARGIEFLESKQAEADRRESVANRSESTCTACRSPDYSNSEGQRPAARPKENAAAVAAAKAAVAKHRVYFVPAPIPPKYLQQPQVERDNGMALRAMLALEKPSQVMAVDCFPGREWKLSACELPKQKTEEKSAGIKGEAETDEKDQKAVALSPEHAQVQDPTILQDRLKSGRSSSHAGVSSVLEFGLDADKGRKRSLPLNESGKDWVWRKAICEYCWTHSTLCDFQGYVSRFNQGEREMLIIQVDNTIPARA
ncbi:hypothetical protein D0869_06783 [Hortaea werneckii]|uniref:Uncharacterized protein n=1 Tax=Hortaea werneckii TaxID=91943 RepID=A0A3M7A5G7_HORWE|nr:hypothetical protein D0869_06783 [Hortaea werneckii]RMY22836.1 hypothetical protein D0867_02453 [Hortaea werneckii]